MLESDPDMADALAQAHQRHAQAHAGHRVAGSGDPEHVKCLHAHLAFALAEGGSAFKSISIPAAGNLKVQYLTGDQPDKILRLGVGTLSGTSCNVAQSVDTAASSADSSPQITTTVSISNICISLKDLGNLTQPSAFTITILLETT